MLTTTIDLTGAEIIDTRGGWARIDAHHTVSVFSPDGYPVATFGAGSRQDARNIARREIGS